MNSNAIDLKPEHRTKLAAWADTLIPGKPPMPAASEVEVHGPGLDRVMNARPSLLEPLRDILEAVGTDQPAEDLQRLRTDDPASFSLLVLVVCSAYYMNDGVRNLIGYPGQVPVLRSDLDDLTIDDSILGPVVLRGPFYRETS